MEQYVIYLRKSRADLEAEAHGEGETLARHEHALLELARREQLNVTQIYREVVSGDTIAARPVMQQLLSEVEEGLWTGVLVMEVARLARGDTMDQGIVAQTFKYSGARIVTPGKTYDPSNEFDEDFFEYGLFMSRNEYKMIKRRLQRGRQASAKEGKFPGSIAPYGYERVKIKNDKGYTLQIVPEHAEIVRLIYSWYVDGETQEDGTRRRLGIQQIARKLNEMHVPPIRHDYWEKATIRDMLINPTYAGKIRWNWRPEHKRIVDGKRQVERSRNDDCILVDGLHEAIIAPDVFSRAQEYIKGCPPAPVGYKSTLKNPLAGLVICGKCGRKMVIRKGYTKPDYIVCHCRACDNVSAPLRLVEERVLQRLGQWLKDYKTEWRTHSRKQDPAAGALERSAKKLDGDISTLSKQLDATHDLLERGIYTDDQFLDRSRTLTERIEQAKRDRGALEKELNLSAARDERRRVIIPKVEHLLKVYPAMDTAAQKNEMLKDVLEKVVYIKTVNGCHRGVSADDFQITLYPRLPENHK